MTAVRLRILLITLMLPYSFAALSNVTVDDQYGDPTNGVQISYSPSASWHIGQSCTVCTSKVTPLNDAWMGTYMDASYFPVGSNSAQAGQIIQASLFFTGVAVYVNVILTGSVNLPTGNSDFRFFIDGEIEGVFQKSPDGDPTYLFNQTVFSRDGLENTLHNLTIEAGQSGNMSLILLDSVIYTADDSSKTTIAVSSSSSSIPVGSSSSSNTLVGVIVGPVIAGVVISGVIFAFLFRRRQHKNDTRNQYNPAEIGNNNQPQALHGGYWSEGEVRPYFIASGSTSSSGDTSLTKRPDFDMNDNKSRMPIHDTLSPSIIQNIPGTTPQMRAVTGNDESASGFEIFSPPAYTDISRGPSLSTPNVSSRPLRIPHYNN